MRPAPRMGLLFATIALPLSAVLASQILGDRPAPKAPVEIRVGDPRSGAEAGFGQPATPPSPAAVRPLVVGEHAPPTTSMTTSDLPTGQTASSSTAVTGTRPVSPGADPPDPPDPSGSGGTDPKGKAKGHGATGHPTPSHGPTPEPNGSEE